MHQDKPIVIAGAGIIGLFSAYFLNKSGHEVLIIDKDPGEDGCSFGNAGMVVPSHFIPLAAPGMIEKGLKWMFDSESPFYVKPRFSLDLLRWGVNFYQAANKAKVDKAVPALRDLGLLSKKLYQDFSKEAGFNFFFEEKGLLMLCKTGHTLEEESEVAHLANKIGIKADILSKEEVSKLEPELKPDVEGGILFPGDAHLYPNELIKNLKKHLAEQGVKFIYNAEITGFKKNGQSVEAVKISTPEEKTIACSKLVIATGSWSQNLGKLLNINLPIQAGKGYSITKKQAEGKNLKTPSILVEARVAITPMADDLIRFGGTMEIGGINDNINMNRVNGIIKAVPEYFPSYPIQTPPKEQIWYGLRPCSPDGLPYIGKAAENLYIASGHAMMGLSLAPATGKLMQEIIEGHKPSVDISLYEPGRF